MLLTVIHRRLPDRSTMLKVGAGWHMHLDILAARATGKEPEPFWDGWSRLQTEYDRRMAGLTELTGETPSGANRAEHLPQTDLVATRVARRA